MLLVSVYSQIYAISAPSLVYIDDKMCIVHAVDVCVHLTQPVAVSQPHFEIGWHSCPTARITHVNDDILFVAILRVRCGTFQTTRECNESLLISELSYSGLKYLINLRKICQLTLNMCVHIYIYFQRHNQRE